MPQLSGPAYLKAKYAARETTNIGTLFEPDFAALAALKPDLIIIAGRSAGQFEKLSALAPTIDLSIAPGQFLAGVQANLQQLGAIFDKEKQAAKLAAALGQELTALHAKTAGQSSLTLFTIKDALMPHAPGERFGMLNEVLGTRAVVEAVDPATQPKARPAAGSAEAKQQKEQQNARLDAALKAQPQWLFDSTAADAYAAIAAARKASGRPISQFDAMIAAITQSRGASLATRNIKNFTGLELRLIDPWQA